MIVFLVLSSFIAALVSGAAGFGGALLLLPVVVYCVGPEQAVPLLTFAQLIGNGSRMLFGFRQIAWKPVTLFLLSAIPFSLIGAFGFSALSKDIVTRGIGAVLILFVLLKHYHLLEFKPGKKILLLGGALVGLISGLVGSAGPLGAAVFLTLDLPPVAYIASEATTATTMHLLKMFVYRQTLDLPSHTLFYGLAMGAAMILGTFLSRCLIQRLKKEQFRKWVGVLLCTTGVFMLLHGK